AGPAGQAPRAGRARRCPCGGGGAAVADHRPSGRAAPVSGKIALGLTAGPVPVRVAAPVKAGICRLVEHVVNGRGAARRAGRLLEVEGSRVARWAARRATGGDLADAIPGGNPQHGLLGWEKAAIVDLYQTWGQTDRSHRKLAHRGSRVDLVHVSPSTLQR